MKLDLPILRDYQESDANRIEEEWKKWLRLIYQLPTGGGKSIVLSKIIADYKTENILVFAHKKKLLTQLRSNLAKFGVKTGLLQGENEIDLDCNIIIVSIRTAVKSKRLDFLLERKWDKVVIDEARHTRTPSYDKVLDTLKEHNPQIKFLGVDATPFRTDLQRLDRHFEYMIVSSETTASLIEKGYLPKYTIKRTPIGNIDKEVERNSDDYQQVALSTYMRQQVYLDYVVDMYIEHGQNKQAIVFAVDKSHAKALKRTFIAKGVTKVEQIDSDMTPEHIEKVFSDYENKRVQVIINIEMVTEGVDLPETGVIIGARPTKSLPLYLQMVGRGTRVSEDGSDLIIIDCCNWTEEHGSLSAPKHWSLNPNIHPSNPSKKNKIVGRRKNGTFVDLDEEEEFIGDIVEMTPEEYLQHLSGGMEKAKDVNLSIDEKIHQLYKAIADLITKPLKSKMDGFTYRLSKEDRRLSRYKLVFIDKEGSEEYDKYELEDKLYYYKKSKAMVILDPESKDSRLACRLEEGGYSGERLVSMMKLSIIQGEVNRVLLESKKIDGQVKEYFEQIKDLEKSKIDLDEFKETAKKFERERWEQSVLQHALEGKRFDLPKKVDFEDIFKRHDFYGVRVYITGFYLPLHKLKKSDQDVEFTIEKTEKRYHWGNEKDKKPPVIEEYPKITYAEKLYTILKEGEWGKEEKV